MATETDKVNTGALATLVAVGAFATLAISLSLVALVRDEVSSEQAFKDAPQGASYQGLKTQQVTKLQAGVPIQQAMSDVVREFSNNPRAATPPGSAVPVPTGSAAAPTGSAGTPAVASSASPDTELAPKPNRQNDGKLPPTGGAPVNAPKPPGGAGSEHEH